LAIDRFRISPISSHQYDILALTWYDFGMARTESAPAAHNDAPKFERGWSHEGENRKLTAEMQFELARRFYGLPKETGRRELDDVIMRWVSLNNSTNSRKFREYVEAHPPIIELYKSDPEAALSEIEEHIYAGQLG
jgi:hypothetical protein